MEEQEFTEVESPLVSDIIRKEHPSKEPPEKQSSHSDITEDQFDSLLNLHKPNPIYQLIILIVSWILPGAIFIGTLILYGRSTLNINIPTLYYSGNSSHGGVIGVAIIGLIATYFSGFFGWWSSIRDRNSTSAPAVVFKVLGWILLIVTFLVVLFYKG
jgi:prolipoprotein diacylglyceryltransferase